MTSPQNGAAAQNESQASPPTAAMPLVHREGTRSDEGLAREAADFLAKHPPVQLVAELLAHLRELRLPWWTPAKLRARFPAKLRMEALAQRPDIRQRITTELTGLVPKAARKKDPGYQAQLVDSAVDEGDTDVASFEAAFDTKDLATYGPVAELWHFFRTSMPWDDGRSEHQELFAWLLRALLGTKSTIDPAVTRKPILAAWHVRSAIDRKVWHTRVPLEVRVAIDDARLSREKERPNAVFGAADDLDLATPEVIASNVPLRELLGVLDVAEQLMGFDKPRPEARPSVPPAALAGASTETKVAVGKSVAPPAGPATSPSLPAVNTLGGTTPTPPRASTPPPAATRGPSSVRPPPATPVGFMDDEHTNPEIQAKG